MDSVETPKDISFLIPTLEKLEPGTNLQKVIDSIHYQPTKYSYEICIYSPYPTYGPNIKWIKEEKKIGPLYGYTYMFQHGAAGEYLFTIVDDHIFVSPFDHIIDKIKSDEFTNRKFKVCSLSTHEGIIQPLPTLTNRWGSILSIQKEDGWPEGIMMRFPVFHRDTLNNLLNRCIFHPEFVYHAGDVWLGTYLSFMGELGLECFESRIYPLPHTRVQNWEQSVRDANTSTALMRNWHAGCRDYVAPELPHYSTERYYKIGDDRPYWEPTLDHLGTKSTNWVDKKDR